jgi:hypothetical protein
MSQGTETVTDELKQTNEVTTCRHVAWVGGQVSCCWVCIVTWQPTAGIMWPEQTPISRWRCRIDEVKVTLRPTVSRLVCVGVRPQLAPVTNFSFYYDALSGERTGLQFIVTAWPHQCSASRVWVPRVSLIFPQLEGPVFISSGTEWPNYTPRHWVPFPLSPTTRRATVEVCNNLETYNNGTISVARIRVINQQ